jgi:hypothetical protein
MERVANMGRVLGTTVLASALLTAPVLAHAADPAPVVAAERAFVADGVAMGWVAAFRKHTAADGIMFAPDPVLTADNLAKLEDKPRPTLNWWPLWAGMARSGDLGFTTGPYTVNGKPGGQYFTVWTKQANGRWAWAFDGGPDVETPLTAPPSSEPGVLAAGVPSTNGWSGVQAAEAILAKAAAADATGAYRAALAPDARIAGLATRVSAGSLLVGQELAARAPRIQFKPLGGGAARAGDLAWTYGDAAWAGGRGHYVRIWRHDRRGWRLVWDELLPVRG